MFLNLLISVWICEYREEEEEEKKADNFFYSTQFIMHNSTNIKTVHSHKQAFWVNKKVSGTNTIKGEMAKNLKRESESGRGCHFVVEFSSLALSWKILSKIGKTQFLETKRNFLCLFHFRLIRHQQHPEIN